MAGFILTNAAKADLKNIGRYTQETWGVEQRNRYLTSLDKCFHELVANPLQGRDCGEIKPGYRKFPIGKHLVFYRINELEQVLIVRILHQRMDVDFHLTD